MSATIAKLAAQAHFVYRAFAADGELLYVGCSLDVKRRMTEHKGFSTWHHLMDHMEVEGPYSYDRAREIERRAIQTEGPTHSGQTPEFRRRRQARGKFWLSVYRSALEHGESIGDAMAQATIACDCEFGGAA